MSCLRSYVLLTVLIMGETLELNYYSEDMDPNTIYTGYLIKFVEPKKEFLVNQFVLPQGLQAR